MAIRTWKDDIREYIPFNEQERADQQQFLQALEEKDILVRDNVEHHVSSSAWIMNETMDQVLMAFHHIYQSYSWLGGHADGDPDLLAVATREAREESGIVSLDLFSPQMIALDILPVPAHIKRGLPVKEHDHLNVTYLFIAPTNQKLTVKADENSAVAWIPVAELDQAVSEERMLPVYRKLITRARQWKQEREQGQR